MSIIWIIEPPRSSLSTIANALIGDFAIRLFASLDSLETLNRFNRRMLPDLLVVDLSSTRLNLQRSREALCYLVPETPILWVQATTEGASSRPGEAVILPGASQAEISWTTRELIASVDRPGNGIIRYKDVLFNPENFEMKCSSQNDETILSPKEALLLKAFLSKPKQRLSRDLLTSEVWRDAKVSSRTLDTHVSRLRKKLLDTEVAIESIYGGGYLLR